ncbi:neuronal acetylcholine receptor subunit alpha-3-like [Mercenaria mercenaria]|uniref:neuronal acetylcholine receptor subunit alpha-3-like n=1 Tax=Mercenaria mercenaria TaxID=6596 RepID=UPI00234ED9FF|nr:neuronal acetylcholine receptor subunit alpha-3-like [Mercenaria mercenaria]
MYAGKEWEDSRLTWDPAANGNIEEIFSKPGNIWKPELVVENSLEDLGIITDDDLYLRLKYDGTVEWEPPRLFITHCQVDITYYPYDKQKCSINLASWGYTSSEVSLDTISTPVNLDDFEQHGEWKITSYNTVKTFLVETLDDGTVRQFPQIEFWLYLERRSAYYNLNVVMPVFVTSLLVALTFIVPVECGEKLSYILTVFLSIAVLLTLVADSIPSTSITTSVLGLYLALVTILSGFGILLTVIILILFHKKGYAKSKSCIMVITRFAAKFTCSSNVSLDSLKNRVTPAPEEEEAEKDISQSDVTNDVTWRDVAIVLDRFCFLVFTLVTVLMNLSFVIALVAGGKATDP